MKADLIERYAANLHGVLSCFDRILITGTLPGACYAAGMTSFLNAHGIRIFDYAGFAEPQRECIRERAQEVCAAAGIEIEPSARATSARKRERAIPGAGVTDRLFDRQARRCLSFGRAVAWKCSPPIARLPAGRSFPA
jgi:hypothetical protein